MKNIIPYYNEINEFLASTPFPNRTTNPDLYCLRVERGDTVKQFYKPPFRRSFYFLALMNDVDHSRIVYDNAKEVNTNSTLVFQAPGLISSFRKTNKASGFLIYFKRNCFSYFKPDFSKEFPFFDFRQTIFFFLSKENSLSLTPLFENAFQDFENVNSKQRQVASLKLLILLYQLKTFVSDNQPEESKTPPKMVLFRKFISLINDHYIEKRTVEEYAALLSVTAKHLSRSVKEASGRNALSHINERVIEEAKSLVLYTDLDMTEICYQLNFSDPANFYKFFKKQVGATPSAFRKRKP